jgi:hypothetical protein
MHRGAKGTNPHAGHAEMIRLVFLADDVTRSGYRQGEGAAFSLDVAARLIARGVAALAVGEAQTEELREAIARALRKPDWRWEMPMVGPRWPGWYCD